MGEAGGQALKACVTAGHPAPTLGEPVPPSQRGTRGFASGAIGSSQSETVTGSRKGNMSY